MPFTNFNRMHVVPPCNITEAEAKEGIAIIDQALTSIAKYYEGKD
jgi:taurine--2-oxoglutarate transaminase